MSEAWPQPLKEWVARCLGQMTDANRTEAQAELREVIADAFAKKTLWTTDWAGVQLQSLLPRQQPMLKRKHDDKPISNKKKKSALAKNGTSQVNTDPNDQAALHRRAERFQREHEIERQKAQRGQPFSQVNPHNNNLFNRIHTDSRSASPLPWTAEGPEARGSNVDWDRYTIIGTSQNLFKDYLRLTTEPDPKDIRPYKVLQETLVELKKRWRENNDYPWICNQFKSIRQDLTVQRIKNEFTVQVYEIHARMALEAGDMVEYNQCQAMLKSLYELGIPGCHDEFTAYRILLLLHGKNRSEMNLFVGQLTGKQKASTVIKHALEVQTALSTNNYHAFFELYSNAPNMGAYIMDHFVDRERTKAMMVMTKAYHQVPLLFIRDELAFDNLQMACEFLTSHRISFFINPNSPDDQKTFDCKPAQAPLAQVFDEKYRKAVIKGAI
ncbi:hypothetical protein BD410DRAFT_856434 [Rickenella mellea]|uniref:PCI domain-containing protein n=1 Tax=Rickenella mellea TaxID=50990 RepID=A0A4Y7Q983_9AGAM|nr:hypothetical protein BD410DRAFT_856434 [Rickenella mellea]